MAPGVTGDSHWQSKAWQSYCEQNHGSSWENFV